MFKDDEGSILTYKGKSTILALVNEHVKLDPTTEIWELFKPRVGCKGSIKADVYNPFK